MIVARACTACGMQSGAAELTGGRVAMSLTAEVQERPPRGRIATASPREPDDGARRRRQRESTPGPHDMLAHAARDRELAALDRARAADDRAQEAADRARAAAERAEALEIRAESARLLERAGTDELTGARTRQVGLERAAHELERARRTRGQLMLAFVDVDGLKQVNDSLGHQAGDALLELVGYALGSNLRPYDVIVRYGGDEFLCAMPDISPHEARARFKQIARALAAVKARYSISFGLAQARPDETLPQLVARADADLLAHRSCRRRTA
jgi:diguanylate cyclase (GGDEF)-like protein